MSQTFSADVYKREIQDWGRIEGVFNLRRFLRRFDDGKFVDFQMGSKHHVELINHILEIHTRVCADQKMSFRPDFTVEFHPENPRRLYLHLEGEVNGEVIRMRSIKIIFVIDEDGAGWHFRSFDHHYRVTTPHYSVVRAELAGPKWRDYYPWSIEFFTDIEERYKAAIELSAVKTAQFELYLNENESLVVDIKPL